MLAIKYFDNIFIKSLSLFINTSLYFYLFWEHYQGILDLHSFTERQKKKNKENKEVNWDAFKISLMQSEKLNQRHWHSQTEKNKVLELKCSS